MPMELPISMLAADDSGRPVGATGDGLAARDLFAVGVFTVVGLAVALGFAMAFPLGDSMSGAGLILTP
jgi:hypothetical protein